MLGWGARMTRLRQKYKKLKRKYLKGALAVVSEYVLPIALENEVLEANEVGEIED